MGNNGRISDFYSPQLRKQNNLKQKQNLKDIAEKGESTEFREFLQKNISGENEEGVKISNHAMKRLHERKLEMDGEEFFKLKEAIDKLKTKGGKDSLVITNKAAYIVDVDNETVVTAMDKNDMSENVVTKIDSTLFVN